MGADSYSREVRTLSEESTTASIGGELGEGFPDLDIIYNADVCGGK